MCAYLSLQYEILRLSHRYQKIHSLIGLSLKQFDELFIYFLDSHDSYLSKYEMGNLVKTYVALLFIQTVRFLSIGNL